MTQSDSRIGRLRSAISIVLRRRVGYRTATGVMVSAVTLVSALVMPLKVTADGIFYVASAKAFFSPEFVANYAWFREPGYPLLLRLIHSLGNDGLFVLIVQAIFLGLASSIALYAVWRSLGHSDVSVGQVIVAMVLTLNPMYLIYSALFLQQALFALQLSLFALGLLWSSYRPVWLAKYALLLLVFVNFIVAIWTSIGWLYLALVPVILTVMNSLRPDLLALWRRAKTTLRKLAVSVIAILGTLLLCVLVYGAGLLAYGGWESIKAAHAEDVSVPTAVIEPLSSAPRIPTPEEMTSRMLALMHMGTVGPYVMENDLFLGQQMVAGRAISQWDTAYVNEPFTTYALEYFSLADPSYVLHFAYAKGSFVAPVVYSAAFVGFMALGLLAVLRRRWKLVTVLLIPLAFLAVYAASNSPIDRYGVPAYPWAVASVSVLGSWLGGWLRARRIPVKLEEHT